MDIDSIDITDSTFSLDVPNIVKGGSGSCTDYTMFIYIGIAIIVLTVGFFIYRAYRNKQNATVKDCEGGFCNMDNEYNQSPEINYQSPEINYQSQEINDDNQYNEL